MAGLAFAGDGCNYDIASRHQYWESRYCMDAEIYGTQPALAAVLASGYADESGAVLELGGAYGRNSAAFEGRCRSFTLIDLSPSAVRIAANHAGRFPAGWLEPRVGDFLVDSWGAPDLVFSNFVLHLLTERERDELLERARCSMTPGSLFINSFLSTQDAWNGFGAVIESRTFHHAVGRFNHFFDRAELDALHSGHGFRIRSAEHLVEPESIAGMIRETSFWFVVAQRTD